ncbi:MAG: gliding motility-associated C-terminal domain-containing protein [Flavobacteriales bacterium]|nr:gliding motility-associated C-terminal domain-containing protein [Flavobacteriales bacterium]
MTTPSSRLVLSVLTCLLLVSGLVAQESNDLTISRAPGQPLRQLIDEADYDRMKAAGIVMPRDVDVRLRNPAVFSATRPASAGVRPKGGGNPACSIWQDPDPCPIAFGPHDDLPSLQVNLPFTFNLYGQYYTSLWINNNGNVTFDAQYGTFSATPFPTNQFVMIAPFWADVDTGDPGNELGTVSYCVLPRRIVVTWDNVGYYNTHGDKRNTFQLILTDGTDPLLGAGNNVAFSYQDMQWTTGDASGGTNGFGGTAAVVGANLGDGSAYIQIGTFDHAGTDYDGPLATTDGVSWLDYRSFIFSTATPNPNIPPLITGSTICDTVTVCVGETATMDISFYAPEPDQQTTPSVSTPSLGGWSITNLTAGVNASISVEFTPTFADVGVHLIEFTANDDGVPPYTTTVPAYVRVVPPLNGDTVPLAVCDDEPPVELMTLFPPAIPTGGYWVDSPIGASFTGTYQPGIDPDGLYTYLEPFVAGCPTLWFAELETHSMSTTLDSVLATCFGYGDGSITATTAGTAGAWDYTWLDAAGAVLQSAQGQNSDTYEGVAGTYSVVVNESISNGACLDTLTMSIGEPPLLEWTSLPDDTLICLTGTASLQALATGGTGTISYQWSFGGSGAGPHGVSPSTQTTYSVSASDANGCSLHPEQVTVSLRPPLSFEPLLPDTECYGIPVLYTVDDATGGDGDYAYNWGHGAHAQNWSEFVYANSGDVCVTVSDGCETPPVTSCAWLEILHTPPIEITADTTFGCVPFSVRMLLTDTTNGATVVWTYGDGSSDLAMDSVVHTYTDAGNFAVGTVITWPNGCVTDTVMHDFVRALTIPIATVTWTPDPATINDPIVQFIDQSVPNVVSWFWDFGELGTSEEQDPTITFPNESGGTYPLTLVVANELGCSDTLRSWVDVHDELMVWVPNAFTPNQEGPNETFFVRGNDISPEEFELLIFDRWGGEVFRTNDLFEAWDGTSKGTALPQGVYPYRLEVHSLSSREKRVIYGHVNLLH